MKDIVRIKSVMTPFPYSIDAHQSLSEARALMDEHQIRHLPVRDGEQLLGVLSDRELQLVIERTRGEAVFPEPKVKDAISDQVYIVDLQTPLAEVAEKMSERRIGSTLVTKAGKLVGVFTVTDACRCLASFLVTGDFDPDPLQKRAAIS